MHVYIAGGAGVVGTRLVPQLVERGHRVTATTTSPAKVAALERLGASAVVVDGLDSAAVGEAVARAEPDAVVHQMTSLAGPFDPKHFDRSFALTNRLRTEGLDHLIAALKAVPLFLFIYWLFTYVPNSIYYGVTQYVLTFTPEVGFLVANGVAWTNVVLVVVLAFGLSLMGAAKDADDTGAARWWQLVATLATLAAVLPVVVFGGGVDGLEVPTYVIATAALLTVIVLCFAHSGRTWARLEEADLPPPRAA